MLIRANDTLNDWKYGRGRNDYLKNEDALKQNLKTRILSWKNDCFFDLQAGVDWNNYLDIGTKFFLDQNVKQVILQTPDVIKINSYESILSDRDLTITANIYTIYGSINFIM
jgi:hypothetical protein